MGIKQSRSELVDLLASNDDAAGALTSHQPHETNQRPAATIPIAAPPAAPAETEPPATAAIAASPAPPPVRGTWRSQGLTIYASDDDLVDNFLDYTRKQKLKIGRKKGFSLFARAGLRALNELLQRDPAAFEATLLRALKEQETP